MRRLVGLLLLLLLVFRQLDLGAGEDCCDRSSAALVRVRRDGCDAAADRQNPADGLGERAYARLVGWRLDGCLQLQVLGSDETEEPLVLADSLFVSVRRQAVRGPLVAAAVAADLLLQGAVDL